MHSHVDPVGSVTRERAAQPARRLDPLVESLREVLRRVARDHAPAAFASSLSADDMVITDVVLHESLPIEIFTLDTGRLHADTLALIDAIRSRYGARVVVYTPLAGAVDAYVAAHGRDAMYASPALRKSCCAIRKVEPLRRALAGKRAWITGLRREQSPTRTAIALQESDPDHGIEKFSPLIDWTERDVWDYIRMHEVPYNRLHDQGYRSIGCAPCTRPVVPGEEVRAGRWWWEQPESRECGLHVTPDGRLVGRTGAANGSVAREVAA